MSQPVTTSVWSVSDCRDWAKVTHSRVEDGSTAISFAPRQTAWQEIAFSAKLLPLPSSPAMTTEGEMSRRASPNRSMNTGDHRAEVLLMPNSQPVSDPAWQVVMAAEVAKAADLVMSR